MKKTGIALGIFLFMLMFLGMPTKSYVSAEEVQPTATPEATIVLQVPELAQPTGLTCKADASLKSSKVSWNAYENAVSYLIYRKNGSGDYQLIQTQAATAFTDSGLTAGGTYTYKVQAKLKQDEAFVATPDSEEKSVKLVPAKVSGFKAKAGRGKIKLKWKSAGKKVSGYEVWSKVNVKLKGIKLSYTKLKNVKSYKKTSLKNKMLVPGMKYSYKIRTYKTVDGKKIYSEYVSLTKKAK